MGDKIIFLNTGHLSLDDRVFYHQAKSLVKQGYDIEIISTKETFNSEIDSVKINSYDDNGFTQKQKLNEIVRCLTASKPRLVIADTPLAVIASSIYRKQNSIRIVYDITEWYPSKKNLLYNKGLGKFFKICVLSIINLTAGFKSDFFIFGEHFKALPFRILLFWKPFIYLPYYPDLNYINYFPPEKIENEFNLTYSGIINIEKGIDAVIQSVDLAASKSPAINFNLRIIGYFPQKIDQTHFEKLTNQLNNNLKITLEKYLSFKDFCSTIGNTHLFLDLREKDIENSNCLPIKLFYYLACGRPVIYSDLKSIKKAIPNINFGYLLPPTNTEKISDAITKYINDSQLYNDHCENALKLSHNQFNWELIEKNFITFIQKAVDPKSN